MTHRRLRAVGSKSVVYSRFVVVVVKMALYKAKKAGQTLAAQKKQEEVSK